MLILDLDSGGSVAVNSANVSSVTTREDGYRGSRVLTIDGTYFDVKQSLEDVAVGMSKDQMRFEANAAQARHEAAIAGFKANFPMLRDLVRDVIQGEPIDLPVVNYTGFAPTETTQGETIPADAPPHEAQREQGVVQNSQG